MTNGSTSPVLREATRQDVSARFVRMLSLVLEQVLVIRRALLSRQYEGLGDATHVLERELDLLERELEDLCLGLISSGPQTEQEVRFALMMFRSVGDLERVGDYGRHVGRDLEAIGGTLNSALSDVLPQLDLLAQMVERLSFAFTEQNLQAARDVMRIDYEDVDALYEQIQRAAVTRILEQPGDLEAALKVNRMARSLERLGDHLVNVAERIEAYLHFVRAANPLL